MEHANAAVVNYGINSKNTLFAQSLCPDEINHEAGDIGDLFTKNLGEVGKTSVIIHPPVNDPLS